MSFLRWNVPQRLKPNLRFGGGGTGEPVPLSKTTTQEVLHDLRSGADGSATAVVCFRKRYPTL